MKSRWIAVALVASLLGFVGSAAIAQEHHDRDKHEHHWDKDHPVFDDNEREVVRGWWGGHRDHPLIGFREEDRLPRDWEPRLAVGFELNTEWRHRLHPVPVDLYGELPPPPPHFHYYVLGGHIVLVDQRNWHVADVINIDF